ncbi:Multifunctional alkaline phosphatase superfamily protein (plasmid) [Pseudoseohaeicola sp. NH-UV-7]|uniref:sulfatase-like hydrolase/transferase n=1 Tax=unclassified Sulfitobacter TaxID=196795 RepID=UPI000E0B9AD1|nr:sulfatase-like hydrolase/transferase [Sulfitobacter sp. JL08]AXI54367.1 phosphonate monoester hydrolase [Sulfitobacter sp. JL08]
MSRRRNVLFITIDQLRADTVFGDLAAHVDMPNLRALMEDAVTFTRHYSVTNPCGPSRASLLTGQYAMNHRSIRNGTPLRHDAPNIATEARKKGYMPMLFGYTDTAQDPRAYPAGDPALTTYEMPMNGFHEAVEMRLEESFPWRADLVAKGYDCPDYADFYKPVAAKGAEPRIDDPAFYSAEDSDTAFLTNAFLRDLAVRGDAPWFSHITYIRPHPPLVAPAPYNRMYDPAGVPMPKRLSRGDEAAIHPFFGPAVDNYQAKNTVSGFADLPEDDLTIRTLRALYLGLATEVDAHIGRILKALKDSGQYDDTLIVISADHGEMLGDRQAWGKMSCYDAAYHTPLIIRDPDAPAGFGRRVSELTEAVDIAPTILRWIGQDVPSSMNGRALQPFVQGDSPEDWRTHSYSELDFGDPVSPTLWQRQLNLPAHLCNLAILRGPRYTLVHFNAGLPPLLFDRAGDGEWTNIAADADAAPILLEMTQRLLNHRMAHADSTLSNIMITADGPVTGTRESCA